MTEEAALRRPGSSAAEAYKPTHGSLYRDVGPSRYCCLCKTHRSMYGQGWRLHNKVLKLWRCPEHK